MTETMSTAAVRAENNAASVELPTPQSRPESEEKIAVPAAYQKPTPTFSFRHNASNTFSAAQVAEFVVGYADTEEGFLNPNMDYRTKYANVLQFSTQKELEEALLKYNEMFDVTDFDYKTFEILFLRKGRLRLFNMAVVQRGPTVPDFERVLEREVCEASGEKAQVYTRLFGVEFQNKRPAANAGIFLPPVYDGRGRHIMGGVPWQRYDDLHH